MQFLQCLPVVLLLSVVASGIQNNPQTKLSRESCDLRAPQWLEIDVRWIACPAEVETYRSLRNDYEREFFQTQFWRRRDPTPSTHVNEFVSEHYRRIAFANQHFSGTGLGALTDRGRIYILHGPPDSIQAYEDGEEWGFVNLRGVGRNVRLRFKGPEKKIAEGSEHLDAFLRDPCSNGTLDLLGGTEPPISGKDLNALLQSMPKVRLGSLRTNPLGLRVEVDQVPVTPENTHVRIRMLLDRPAQPQTTPTRLRYLMKVWALTGRVVQISEGETAGPLSGSADFPLRPGRYRLEVAVEDTSTGVQSVLAQGLHVLPFADDK